MYFIIFMNHKFTLCMKTLLSPISIAAGLIMLITSCTHTRLVHMNALRPAEITMPREVQKIIVVNRTKFDKKAKEIIEGVFTGELPGDDRKGVIEAIFAFQQNVTQTPRFKVEIAEEVLEGNSVMTNFPDPLSWEEVEKLCNKYEADVLIAAEVFDTDFIVTSGANSVKVSEGPIPRVQFYARGNGSATIGFRLYDPVEKIIVDEQLITERHHWEASGPGIINARSSLIGRAEAIKYVSRLVGGTYAYKISPMPVRVTRTFYSKHRKSPEIAIGARYGDVNQWAEALEAWERGLPHARRKQAGYLCYNIAIAHEVQGNLDSAIEWAQKSYVEYRDKRARDYVRRLRNRAAAEERLEEQL